MSIQPLPKHWIVQRDCHPSPAPKQHSSEDDAIAEARRLAAKTNKPGAVFFVYQLVGVAVVAEPSPPVEFTYAEYPVAQVAP